MEYANLYTIKLITNGILLGALGFLLVLLVHWFTPGTAGRHLATLPGYVVLE